MKDLKFTIGFILVLLASIACGLSGLFWIIAIPVFVIGVILILISKKSVTTKLLSAFAPFVLIVAGASLFLHFSSKTTPETYLIPADFQGRFRVIYGEACGVQPAEENGRRVLQIPSNGILIVTPQAEYGTIDHEYYFVDASGKRTPAVNVSLESTGNSSAGADEGIEFANFFVGNPAAITVLTEDDFEALTDVAVEECRKN